MGLLLLLIILLLLLLLLRLLLLLLLLLYIYYSYSTSITHTLHILLILYIYYSYSTLLIYYTLLISPPLYSFTIHYSLLLHSIHLSISHIPYLPCLAFVLYDVPWSTVWTVGVYLV